MYLGYDEANRGHIVFFDDEDRCRFCMYLSKCPLVSALQLGDYCIPIKEKLPVNEFCELYEPSAGLRKIEQRLKKYGKYREL